MSASAYFRLVRIKSTYLLQRQCMHGCINTCFANKEVMVNDGNVIFGQLNILTSLVLNSVDAGALVLPNYV